jgi:tetratricopeptide (TPR) repeat protein
MSYPDNSALCARSQFMRGALREQQGELASAIKLFREISEKYPLSPTGLQTPLYIASCYQKHGMNDEVLRAYDQAAANYRNLIEMNPYSKTVPVLQELLALAYVRRGTPRQAIDALIGFAGKFPKSEASPYALAIAAQVYHEKLNDAPEAIKLYNQVVKSYPATALAKESRLKIGNLYVHMRDFPKAQAEYTAVLRQYPNDPLIGAMSHKALGLAYDFEGKWGLAQKEFDALLQQYPNSREALQVPFLIAAHYNRANRPAEADAALESAVRQYKDVITRNPGKPVAVEAQEMIANSCLLRKKEGEAIEALALLRATYPRDPRAASALFKIASIYENGARDAAKAADMYQQFLATYPDHELSFTAKTRLDKIRSEKRECQKI